MTDAEFLRWKTREAFRRWEDAVMRLEWHRIGVREALRIVRAASPEGETDG